MARRRRRTGAGSRTRRGWTANTKAPKSSYAIPAGSGVGGKGKAKYPINTLKRARNALSRVGANGTAAEKRMVYRAVARKYPALARRSSVPAVARKARRRGGTSRRGASSHRRSPSRRRRR